MANAASTRYDIAMQYCSGAIPKAKVVIAALCGQKAHVHSALRVHMEQVDILVGEEAQQDMDLKSAFVPAIPRQPFLRFFFHEYGHRVGMVPRSSLKEGKYSQMVEKRTKTTQQQKTTANHSPKGRVSTIL